MTTRLRLLLLPTTLLYALGSSFFTGISGVYTGPEAAAHAVIGALLGGLAVFLSDNTSRTLHLRDAVVNLLFYAMLALMFAAFTLRGNFIYGTIDFFGSVTIDTLGAMSYLWRFTWRGAILGIAFWLLTVVNIGLVRNDTTGLGIVVGGVMIGLLGAPFIANALFNGALFVVAGLGARLTLALVVPWMPVWWQGFWFGAMAGLLVVLLPFVGYYGFGAVS
ncbi:MAG: hypothetical protein AAF125_25195 [Chloroflexota bacterium]